MVAAPPAWWASRHVTNGNPVNDYAPINQGQLKNLIKGAIEELDSHLSNGAGQDLDALIANWATPTVVTDDYSAVNIGQLKAVAALVYDRLNIPHPWKSSAKEADDFALANIGQAKNLFAFDLTMDTNSVGIPDWWRSKFGLSFSTPADALVSAPGGISYLKKYQLGLNPLIPDSDGDGADDGTEITEGSDPSDPNSKPPPPPPLIAVATSASVEPGGDATIQLTASGGIGPYSFSIVRAAPTIGTVGTLGALDASGSVTFTARDDATQGTWFDYQVDDANGQTANGTLSILVEGAAIFFESRSLLASNKGGTYENSTETTTRDGSWDVSGLSATDKGLNTIAPAWSGWNTGDPVKKKTGGGGYGYPFDLSKSPTQAEFDAEPLPDGWSGSGALSVSSYLTKTDHPNETKTTHDYENPSTTYPYSFTVYTEDGTEVVLYRLPKAVGESDTLEDYEEKSITEGSGYVAEWQAEKTEVRMVRSGSSTHQIKRTLTKTRDVNGVTTTESVIFTIAEGANESNAVQLSAYVAATGTSTSMSETLDIPASFARPAALGQDVAYIEIHFVDRDNANAKWDDPGQPKELTKPGVPLYSGKGNGDMVKFMCFGDVSAGDILEWKAIRSDGHSIQGPKGNPGGGGLVDWDIYEGWGAPPGVPTELRWKPGEYRVICSILKGGHGPAVEIKRDVRIGFRTDDFVIVGQVVPTTAHSLSAARQQTIKMDLMRDTPPLYAGYLILKRLGPLVTITVDGLLFAVQPELIVVGWAGWYALVPRTTNMVRSIEPINEKPWIIQTMLNAAPDDEAQRLPDSGDILKTEAELRVLRESEQFRIYERFQAKGLVGIYGDLQNVKTAAAVELAPGTTKYPSLLKGQLWDFHLFGTHHQSPGIHVSLTETSEWPDDHRINGRHSNAKSLSFYGTGRIGLKGRKVQWHLLNKDAPWIYGEIQFNSKGAGEFPDWKIYASLGMTMSPAGDGRSVIRTGEHPFNNLSVFKRKVDEVKKRFERIAIMKMKDQVKYFIESVPGNPSAWPVLPPSPHTN